MADDNFLTNLTDDDNPMVDMKKDEQLPDDFDTPFSAPGDVEEKLNKEHPITDAKVDSAELYDAGEDAAAGVVFPGDS